MSENLNEMVQAVVEDARVITVPIDDTLQNSGEAADAKAVGDALALKADKSELQTAITVNGQAADAQGKISQQTEDLVGPYALHDFYLYHTVRFGFTPTKVYALACKAFKDDFDSETVKKWLKNFYRRFFTQQFKRSCLPDGPKVGSVSVSPRGDLRMPSDACATIWLEDLKNIQ
mgnify:CR=1 FL=1